MFPAIQLLLIGTKWLLSMEKNVEKRRKEKTAVLTSPPGDIIEDTVLLYDRLKYDPFSLLNVW